MKIEEAIAHTIDGQDLSSDEMQSLMTGIMSGDYSDAQIASLLTALAAKGETMEEISAAADVMRNLAIAVPIENDNAIDIVGTGGDGLKTVNVSTASAVVAAACGATVAKHGNRAASSSSGSADFLEKAGIPMTMSPEQVTRCIDTTGIGFMFAPNHHPAMKHAITARKDIKVRTIFNYLGPLTNPAGVRRILLGVSNPEMVRPMAGALDVLGYDMALVVHGDDGMDEISITGPTSVALLSDGQISEFRISPDEVGLTTYDLNDIVVEDADDSLAKINDAFNGNQGAVRDVIALNAGAGLYAAGIANSIEEGVGLALGALDDGRAAKKLAEWAKVGQELVDA